LCNRILWMEDGQVRAYGDAGEIAEQYMNEVNLQALANQGTALQSHRGGTGEVRFEAVETLGASGAPSALFTQDDAMIVRASYRTEKAVDRPIFQIAIVDVDTGVVVTTASSAGRDGAARVDGRGEIDVRFNQLPLRPRQYVLRLSITDGDHLASYDTVTAGPRFAITGHGGGVDSLVDEQDGLITVPFEFDHRPGTPA